MPRRTFVQNPSSQIWKSMLDGDYIPPTLSALVEESMEPFGAAFRGDWRANPMDLRLKDIIVMHTLAAEMKRLEARIAKLEARIAKLEKNGVRMRRRPQSALRGI